MERDNNQHAISEFTHAINAINYLTSLSLGTRLVLRAKDILLIAHHERASLEGNMEICSAILDAFPNGSVRQRREVAVCIFPEVPSRVYFIPSWPM